MGKDQLNKKTAKKRWEVMQLLEVQLPEPTAPAAPEIDPKPSEQAVAMVVTNYPLLRLRLRDRGIPFKADFTQREVASQFGRTTRTIRDWTRQGLISYLDLPGGPSYPALAIEDFLQNRARSRKEGKWCRYCALLPF